MRKLLFLMVGFSLLNFLGMTNLNAQVALPYSINFGESQEGWTVIDNSTVKGKSWTFDEKGAYNQGTYYPCVTIKVDYSADCDDYYISPGLSLKTGVEYTVSTIACGSTFDAYGSAISLVIGTSADDVTTFKKVGDLNVPNYFQNSVAEKTKLTVEADGIYYIAFHSTTLKFNAETYLFGFSISKEEIEEPEPEKPASLPYEIDFRGGVEGWTSVDNNNDGTMWVYYSDYGVAMDMAFSSHDDDYVSPAFMLESGKQYKINTIVAVNGQPSSIDRICIMQGKNKGTFSEVKQLALTAFGENNEELYFVPEENSLYYFTFRNISGSFGNTLLLYHFAISEMNDIPEPEITIFSTDFSGENPMKDWTTLDVNGDGVTWSILNGLDGVTYNGNNASGAADDWLITPAVSLTEEHDYLIKYTLVQTGAFEEDNIEIKWGDKTTEAGLSELLAIESINIGSGEISKTCRFSCSKTSEAYIGFHITTPDMNGTLSLINIEIIAVGKAIPLPIEDLQLNSDFKAKSVILKWKNPLFDTKQSPIISPLKVNIYENENLVETLIDDIFPGDSKEFTYKPLIPFTGEVTYKVTAVIGDKESEPVSATICLDDMQGDTILVQNFSLDNQDDFNQWVIEDKNGGNTWTYVAWDKATSIPKMSRDNNDWLISPMVNLTADKRYVIQYEMSSSIGYGASFDVTIGDAQNANGQTTVLASYNDLKQNGYAEYVTRQFSVNEDGNYYIGFHAGIVENGISLKNIRISYIGEKTEEVPLMELPYHQNFDIAATMPEGWKITGNTGAYGFNVIDVADNLGLPDIQAHSLPNAVYAIGGAPMPRTEFLYTPKFEFKKGMEYAVEFYLLMPELNGKKNALNVYIATEQDEANIIGNSLYEIKDGISAWTKQHFIFMPENDGEYTFIIKVTCPLTNAGYIMLDDFSIAKNVSVAVPSAPIDFRGSVSILNSSINLNWNNPFVDINGNKLISGTEIRTQLFENDRLLGEITGEVGEQMSFVYHYNWDEFQGQKIIKAISHIQDLKGGASTCLINISSLADAWLKETAFKSDFGNSEKWTIVDSDNDEKSWNVNTSGKIASTGGNDDWLISPVIKLEKGKNYYVLCELKTNVDEGADIKFTMGNNRNIEDQTTEIALYEKLTLGDFESLEIGEPFTAEHEDNFLGIHVANNTGEVVIKDIKIIRLFEEAEPEGMPYTEDFENMDNIDNVTQFTNKWGRRTGSANLFKISKMPENTIPAHSGKYAAVAEEFKLGGRYEILYTPMFDLKRGREYKVTYYLYMPGNEGRKTIASVSASPMQENPGIELEVLQKVESPVTEWTDFSFIYKAKDDQPYCFYFYFETTEANAGIIAFDDFSIKDTNEVGIDNIGRQTEMYFIASTSTLVLPQNFCYLTIYDALGRFISNIKVESDHADLSMLSKGFYYIQAHNNEGEIISLKIMK